MMEQLRTYRRPYLSPVLSSTPCSYRCMPPLYYAWCTRASCTSSRCRRRRDARANDLGTAACCESPLLGIHSSQRNRQDILRHSAWDVPLQRLDCCRCLCLQLGRRTGVEGISTRDTLRWNEIPSKRVCRVNLDIPYWRLQIHGPHSPW